jgi:7,8-dihydroneopterin aldolase/epimerase/oxygenase
MAELNIKGMRFYGYHGVHAEERVKGGWFEVDIMVQWQPDDNLLRRDDLQATIDYEQIYIAVQAVMQTPVSLIERLALLIHDAMQQQLPAGSVSTVRVRKLLPPVGGEVQYAEFVWKNS